MEGFRSAHMSLLRSVGNLGIAITVAYIVGVSIYALYGLSFCGSDEQPYWECVVGLDSADSARSFLVDVSYSISRVMLPVAILMLSIGQFSIASRKYEIDFEARARDRLKFRNEISNQIIKVLYESQALEAEMERRYSFLLYIREIIEDINENDQKMIALMLRGVYTDSIANADVDHRQREREILQQIFDLLTESGCLVEETVDIGTAEYGRESFVDKPLSISISAPFSDVQVLGLRFRGVELRRPARSISYKFCFIENAGIHLFDGVEFVGCTFVGCVIYGMTEEFASNNTFIHCILDECVIADCNSGIYFKGRGEYEKVECMAGRKVVITKSEQGSRKLPLFQISFDMNKGENKFSVERFLAQLQRLLPG